MNLNDLRMSLKAALDNMWARIDARITAIEQGGGGGGVSGVKGDAEANYRTGQVNLTPANIGAVNKTTSDTMTGDLTLSANGGTVKLHPYWDSTDGQSLGVYINAKNTGALNAIFFPLIADNAGGHNIRLLSDLEPVKVTQGGTGATAAGFTPLNNLGLQYEMLTLAFSNGTASYNFPNPVHLIGCRGLVGETVLFSRTNGFTGHMFFSIRNPTYTGNMNIDVYYAVINS